MLPVAVRLIAIVSFLANLSAHSADVVSAWHTWQTEFQAESWIPNATEIDLTVTFVGPDGGHYNVPAFWDGDRRWIVRLAPGASGEWSFSTACPPTGRQPGLHCRTGGFYVQAPGRANPLFQHGGILRVSPDHRYLTYSDGTPFFWLGDTWWFCPSEICPFNGSSNPAIPSMFKALVDTRRRQGFTTAQVTFLGNGGAEERLLSAPWSADALLYWRDVDDYFAYANEAGLVLIAGIGFHEAIDSIGIEKLKSLWRYIVARYGAYAVTWLIVGEYNQNNMPLRVQKVLELGRYIKEIDPYRRAMTVHP